MLACHAGKAGLPRLVAGIGRLEGPFAALERQEKVPVVNELIARVVRDRMHPGIHSDRVTRTRLDAVAAEDAAKLVNDEPHGVPLVATALVSGRIFASVYENALSRTRGRTTEAGHAAHAAVLARREPMNATKTLGIRPFLFE